jgi:hypothetical protein
MMTDHGITSLLVLCGRWELLCRCGAALSGAGDVHRALDTFNEHGAPTNLEVVR